jgi:hypothetical protein
MSEKKKYVEVVGSRVLIQKIRDSFRGSMLLIKSGDVISGTPADFDSILELYGGPSAARREPMPGIRFVE